MHVAVLQVAASLLVDSGRLKVEWQSLELTVAAAVAGLAGALGSEEVGVADAVRAVVGLVLWVAQVAGTLAARRRIGMEAEWLWRVQLQVVELAVDFEIAHAAHKVPAVVESVRDPLLVIKSAQLQGAVLIAAQVEVMELNWHLVLTAWYESSRHRVVQRHGHFSARLGRAVGLYAAVDGEAVFEVGFVNVHTMPQAVRQRAVVVVEDKGLALCHDALTHLEYY